MVTNGNKNEAPIDNYLYDSDPDLLPSALGTKYSYIINTLFQGRTVPELQSNNI